MIGPKWALSTEPSHWSAIATRNGHKPPTRTTKHLDSHRSQHSSVQPRVTTTNEEKVQ